MGKLFKTTFKLRRGSTEAWEKNNPILEYGEPGFDKDQYVFKIGDGSKNWRDLKPIGAVSDEDIDARIVVHNESIMAHSDIRTLIQQLSNRLNILANSDDVTLDQMGEIVAYIKNNKSLIDSITTAKVNVSDIIDNLATNVSNKPLSAAQGVELKRLIDILGQSLNDYALKSELPVVEGLATEEYVDDAIAAVDGNITRIKEAVANANTELFSPKFVFAEEKVGAGDKKTYTFDGNFEGKVSVDIDGSTYVKISEDFIDLSKAEGVYEKVANGEESFLSIDNQYLYGYTVGSSSFFSIKFQEQETWLVISIKISTPELEKGTYFRYERNWHISKVEAPVSSFLIPPKYFSKGGIGYESDSQILFSAQIGDMYPPIGFEIGKEYLISINGNASKAVAELLATGKEGEDVITLIGISQNLLPISVVDVYINDVLYASMAMETDFIENIEDLQIVVEAEGIFQKIDSKFLPDEYVDSKIDKLVESGQLGGTKEESITWDGNTEGLAQINIKEIGYSLFKVSDKLIQPGEVTVSLSYKDENFVINAISGFGLVVLEELMCISGESGRYDLEGLVLTIPETGTYFVKLDDLYLNYLQYKITNTIDQKYLPIHEETLKSAKEYTNTQRIAYVEDGVTIYEADLEPAVEIPGTFHGNLDSLSTNPLEEGKIYTVITDSGTYTATCKFKNNAYIVGNAKLIGGDDTGESFIVISQYDSTGFWAFIICDFNYGTHVKIATQEVIHKIDPKFLPEGGVGYTETRSGLILSKSVITPMEGEEGKGYVEAYLSAFGEGVTYFVSWGDVTYETTAQFNAEINNTVIGDIKHETVPFSCYIDEKYIISWTGDMPEYIEIYTKEDLLHKINPKYLPEITILPSDVLKEVTLDDSGYYISTEPIGLIEGQKYSIITSSGTFESIGQTIEDDIVAIGNINILDDGWDGSGESYLIVEADGQIVFADATNTGTKMILCGPKPVIKTEYLPGVCLPVVELETTISKDAALSDADKAKLSAINGSPFILKTAYTDEGFDRPIPIQCVMNVSGIGEAFIYNTRLVLDAAVDILLANAFSGDWIIIIH